MAGIPSRTPPYSQAAPQVSVTASIDVQKLAPKFKKEIEQFTQLLRQLLDNPGKSQDASFLKEMKNAVVSLAETSKSIQGE